VSGMPPMKIRHPELAGQGAGMAGSQVLVLVVGGCRWSRAFDVNGSAKLVGVGWHSAPLGQSEIGHIE
ncbi:hypothetical protein ACFW08_36925, partial [Streptomyces sp. NPDC058960]|uniref:hypothetical protein n=1 Tax=Streptomyces sp. NPDC058960 TaxID=3346679 RepID=UPI0036C69056